MAEVLTRMPEEVSEAELSGRELLQLWPGRIQNSLVSEAPSRILQSHLLCLALVQS